MSANSDLGLRIPVEAIGEHLVCPVCMNRLKQTYITPCGHRYCEPCITEWISRNRRCPCCNTQLNKDQLIKDALFDNLVDSVNKEESSAETQYFDHLISAAAENAFHDTNAADSADNGNVGAASDKLTLFSPIEKVLKDHLKQSLISHEKFYQDLLSEQRRRKAEVETRMRTEMYDLRNCGLSAEEEARRIAVVESNAAAEKQLLDDDLARSTKLVAEAYDRYLLEHIPDFSILPVTVGVTLLNKGIQLSDIILKPQDSLEDLQKIIREYLKKTGDDVIEFCEDIKYLCFSPFAKCSLHEMKELVSDIIEKSQSYPPDVTILPKGCRPVLQMSIKPGSEIALYGMVKCESDIPKQCFAVTFNNNSKSGNANNLPMDYFHCKNCSSNWICRPCMDVCHKDHNVAPYILNHIPTWPCCYCPKKKKCHIQS